MIIMNKRFILCLLCALALGSCGGGGSSGGGNDTPQTSNNWDEMKWDQGRWQ